MSTTQQVGRPRFSSVSNLGTQGVEKEKKRSTRRFGKVLNLNNAPAPAASTNGPMVTTLKQKKSGATLKPQQKWKGVENDESTNKEPSLEMADAGPSDAKPAETKCNKEITTDDDAAKCSPKKLQQADNDNNNNAVHAVEFKSDGALSFGDDLLIPAQDQVDWITRKGAAENDINYFIILIRQRYSTLLETLQENDKLEKELEHLRKENTLLADQTEKIADLKELLLGTAGEEQADPNSRSV